MATDHRTKLAGIKTLSQLIAYLRDEMNWPIAQDSFEDVDDLFYDFTADELGIDPKTAAKIESIKRLRPLSVNQPWGIFFVKFEPKKLPVVALRRILGQVALKKRPSANSAERAAWAADDLLFISNYGEGSERQITFAHFAKAQGGQNLPTLKVLGWDNRDTALHLDAVAKELTEHLAWPAAESEAEAWRTEWRGAFTLGHGEVITTSKQLSIRLAGLARDIRDRIQSALRFETDRGPLTKLMKAFQTSLVHDLKPDDFADMYAQTIAYGLLSARIADPHRKTVDDFAGHMRTNPFLRELMETFLKVGGRRGKAGGPGIDFDELGVNEVVELLDAANMEAVVRDFGDKNPQEDPVIHFYEDFLRDYDPREKKQRGVFYTPRPVVSFIVRSVDELLRTEFGLVDGLADTTTWGEMVKLHTDLKIPENLSPDQAFVQILDPATGTGTFLVVVIDIIYKTMVAKWTEQGYGAAKIAPLWNEYVPKHLLPRLHAYELLMAPYAIAHLKVGLKLYETGYRFGSDERARIYLTNALEPAQDFSGTLEFAIPALAHESQAVNEIKKTERFTVVLGNPPYFAEAGRGGDWIAGLMRGRDSEGDGVTHNFFEVDGAPLGERTAKWINDDYVKFVRLAERLLERVNCGVLGFVTNHSWLDNPTFRGVRQSLLVFFQRVAVLDLHGNSTKKERSPYGNHEENVFDIKQGVAISVMARLPHATSQQPVLWSELWGPRVEKYAALGTLGTATYSAIFPSSPQYLLIPQDIDLRGEYERGVNIADLFSLKNHGIITKRDGLTIQFTSDEVWETVNAFAQCPPSRAYERFNLPEDVRDWSVVDAQRDLRSTGLSRDRIHRLCYRPLNFRYTYYTGRARGFIGWPVEKVMRHMLGGRNVALVATRQTKDEWGVLATRDLVGHKACGAYDVNTVFPLYLDDEEATGLFKRDVSTRQVNLDPRYVEAFDQVLRTPVLSRGGAQRLGSQSGAEALFDYAYAAFYSPSYRARYSQFLKSEFPRLPVPGSVDLFQQLVRLGHELVSLHLLESPTLDRFITTYVGPKNPEVARVSWSGDTAWLDGGPIGRMSSGNLGTLGFKGVPEAVWTFHIGGYQVCEKWLKDRKGRTLSKDDIAQYQKIVVAVSETIRLMKEIDEVIEQHGGWPGAFQAGETRADESPLLMVAEPEAKYGSDADAPEGEAGRDQGRISFQ